jgi:tRNA A-37 threonylcarbamoyl transferase component Bud32
MTDQAVGTVAHAGLRLQRRYRLDSVIATGGMGTVWAGEDLLLGRRVAVKVLLLAATGDPLAADRVRREARAAASLRHPNVACVYDYGHEDGLDFLVMELLDGESLAARLYELGALRPDEAAWVATEVAGALDAAHRAGVVHRDVKPGNIVLTADGEVKLLDFGIAASAGQRASPGQDGLVGTAPYLAPECALGAPADPASDVYALGVVVYEMLAGRPPFTGESMAAVAAAHVHNTPPPLASLAPGVPPAMAAVCERALAKDPAARPPSAGALAAQLTAALAVRAPAPSTAPPPRAAPAMAARPNRSAGASSGPGARRAPGPVERATVPVWRPAATVQGFAPPSRERRGAPLQRRPEARPRRPGRARWRTAAVALVAVLALAAALQGSGMLQDLLGVRGTSGGAPSIEQPLGGSGGTGPGDATAGDGSTGSSGSSGSGSSSGGEGSNSHGGASDAADSRLDDLADQGSQGAGQGGGEQPNGDGDHSGPGRGGDS